MAQWYWLMVIGLGGIFGSSFASAEYALREAGPFTIGATRSLFAALACWTYLLISDRKIPRDADILWKLMLLGMFSYAFGNVFGPMAQQHISSGLAAVFTVTLPVLTMLECW